MKKIIIEEISRNRELMGLKPFLIKESFVGAIDELIEFASKKLMNTGKNTLKSNLDTLLSRAANETEKLDTLITFVRTNSSDFGDSFVNSFTVKFIDGLDDTVKAKIDDIENLLSQGKVTEDQLKRLLSDRRAGLMKDADPDTIDLVFDYLKKFIKNTPPPKGATSDSYDQLFNSLVGKSDNQIDQVVLDGYDRLKQNIKLNMASLTGNETKKNQLQKILDEIEELEKNATKDLTQAEVTSFLAKIDSNVSKLPDGDGFKRWWRQFKSSSAGKFGTKILNWVALLSFFATAGYYIYIKLDDFRPSGDNNDLGPVRRDGPREKQPTKNDSDDDVDWSQYRTGNTGNN